jgi:hypothetical protein
MNMKKAAIVAGCAITMGMLGGCGGGGSSSAPPVLPPSSGSTTTVNTGTTATVDSTLVAVDPSATTVGGTTVNWYGSAQKLLVKFAGSVNLTVSGSANNIWIAEGQAVGIVDISGNANTIVFKPGVTVTSLTVTGSGNTLLLPAGSPIKIDGAGVNANTVKYYTQ